LRMRPMYWITNQPAISPIVIMRSRRSFASGAHSAGSGEFAIWRDVRCRCRNATSAPIVVTSSPIVSRIQCVIVLLPPASGLVYLYSRLAQKLPPACRLAAHQVREFLWRFRDLDAHHLLAERLSL